MVTPRLTRKARNVWVFIERYVAAHGLSPSHREIAAATGMVVGGTLSHTLKKLEAAGIISRQPGAGRSIVLLKSTDGRRRSNRLEAHPTDGRSAVAPLQPRYVVIETVDGTPRQLNQPPLGDIDARALFDSRVLLYGRDRDCILHMCQGDFNHVEARRDDGALVAVLDIVEADADDHA